MIIIITTTIIVSEDPYVSIIAKLNQTQAVEFISCRVTSSCLFLAELMFSRVTPPCFKVQKKILQSSPEFQDAMNKVICIEPFSS